VAATDADRCTRDRKRESDTLTLDVIVDGDTVYHERTPIEG